MNSHDARRFMTPQTSNLEPVNRYADDAYLKQRLQEEGHRAVVGGRWDDIGQLQHDFLWSQGLKATSRLLDVGAGAFRGGVRFAATLNPGCYFAIDRSLDLLEAGYTSEIVPAALDARFPRTNFAAVEDFMPPFGVAFDFALAVSVFTHLPLARLNDCLTALRPHMAPGGRFYLTVFEGPVDRSLDRPDGIVTHPDRDPFHFDRQDVLAQGEGRWSSTWLGDWGHPREQQMVLFEAT